MKEQELTTFLTYTERFDRIMQHFPFELRTDLDKATEQLSLTKAMKDPKQRTAVLRYINLCSEEFFLAEEEHRLIPNEIWEIWKQQIAQMFRSPLLREFWPLVRSHYEQQGSFYNFVEQAQAAEVTSSVSADAE